MQLDVRVRAYLYARERRLKILLRASIPSIHTWSERDNNTASYNIIINRDFPPTGLAG